MDYQRIEAILIGNATQDAELKEAREGGSHYGDFRLAVGDRNGDTNYFPIRCFGKLAESVSNIKKGAKLFVAGALEISAFTDDTGEKRMTFRVVAETYRILNPGHRTPATDATPPPSGEDTEA